MTKGYLHSEWDHDKWGCAYHGVAPKADPVPAWVHMADVPPPTDEEPWLPRENADDARRMRDYARLATVVAIVGLCVLLTIAWWGD